MDREAIKHIKTWSERCEEHPDHQTGMISERMIQERMQEEIDELRQALAQPEQEPVANEVQLNIIRYWPDDFAVRLESMWKDLIGFIPNYKLYDLQKMLAEFGFTMVLYEGNRPQAREWVGLTDDDYEELLRTRDWGVYLIEAVEAKLKEKNHG